MSEYTLVGPLKQVLTMRSISLRGPIKDEDLHILGNVGILIKNGRISSIDDWESLKSKSQQLACNIIALSGNYVCIPGLIDMHTHICFAGSRARDYAMRNAGKTYLEIAKAGGGIWDSVQSTRAALQKDLIDGILTRVDRLKAQGVTTAEVKSGYGLSVQEELKMLRAINIANSTSDIELIPTCLAAHIFPKDFDGNIEEYLAHIVQDLFPIIQEEKLCRRVDAFIEEEAFNQNNISIYFDAAKKAGFDITVHADQFHTGGSRVAVDYNAVSADHLEASTDNEIDFLAKSNTVAVALPGATLGLGCAFTPARKLLDAGSMLAIASDWNPGSAPMGDLLTQACLLGTFQKLSNAELLAAMSIRAAKGLNLYDRGVLQEGFLADFICFNTDDYREIFYHQGTMKPQFVFKEGKLLEKE